MLLVNRSQTPGTKGMAISTRPVGVQRIQKAGRLMIWTDTEDQKHKVDLDNFKHIEVAQF